MSAQTHTIYDVTIRARVTLPGARHTITDDIVRAEICHAVITQGGKLDLRVAPINRPGDPAFDAVDEWDTPTCLRWLANHTDGPNSYGTRSFSWDQEVHASAQYERDRGNDITDEEYDDQATAELRQAVRDRMLERS